MNFEIINSKDLDNFNNDFNIKYLKEKEKNNNLQKEIYNLKKIIKDKSFEIKNLNKDKSFEIKSSNKSVITTITKNINGKLNTKISVINY